MTCPECDKTTRLMDQGVEMLEILGLSDPPKLLGYVCPRCGCRVYIEERNIERTLKEMGITPCD